MRITRTNLFKRSYKRCLKRGKVMDKLDDVIRLLAEEKTLPSRYKDHPLTGNYKGSRECHIEPDWLLIYSCSKQVLVLEDTGSHADLFE